MVDKEVCDKLFCVILVFVNLLTLNRIYLKVPLKEAVGELILAQQ